MDNVNVLRTGFYAPEFSLPDSNGEIFSLSDNLKDRFLALCFFPPDPDERIRKRLKDLGGGLPDNPSGIEVRLIGVCPEKIKVVSRLKNELNLRFPVLADSKLAVSARYYVLDTERLSRSVHFSIIVVDPDRIIRYRVSEYSGYMEFDADQFKSEISGLI